MIPQVQSDIFLYIRRVLKQFNQEDITDDTLLEYLNRFVLYHMPYQIQLFALRTQYEFETIPNVDTYDLPVDRYNAILPPAYVDGSLTRIEQSIENFEKLFPRRLFNQTNDSGDGTTGPYTFTISRAPFVRSNLTGPYTTTNVDGPRRGGVFITAQSSITPPLTQMVVRDDGAGNLIGDGSGTVDYLTGDVSVTFDNPVVSGTDINSQTEPYQAGRPQVILFNNNIFTLRPVPDKAYLIRTDAYITLSEFLSTNNGQSLALQWLADYWAHGAALMILKDQGDVEQVQFYTPIFRQYENEVVRRTSRQNSTQRAPTIYSAQIGLNPYIFNTN